MMAVSLSVAAAQEIVGAAEVEVRFVRPENHTWLIATADAACYLKAHTKPWYGDNPDDAARTVRHEATAHRHRYHQQHLHKNPNGYRCHSNTGAKFPADA